MNATLDTGVTCEGKAILRAYCFESARLFEEPKSFIANLIVETDTSVASVHRIECETAEEAMQHVERWSLRHGLHNRY